MVNIEDVVKETVIGLFSAPVVWDALVLKGGAALRMGEGIESRMSLDIDLSARDQIIDPSHFFAEAVKAIKHRFEPLGYDVVDAKHGTRPKRPIRDDWRGWEFTFKLSDVEFKGEPLNRRIKSALIPTGSNSSRIMVQISEGEFTDLTKEIKINGVSIKLYSEILIILEKIRAICQQHPKYKHSLNKNRARDYYDIFQVYRKYRRVKGFHDELKKFIVPVFEAKEVPLGLLDDGMFDVDFLTTQKLGFPSVRDTVSGPLEEFDYYVEQLKILVKRILN